MKKEKYNITTYHCESFCISLEVSKTAFNKALKEAQKQAYESGVCDIPNDNGEYIETRFRDRGNYTETTFIVGCGCSETRFIKETCKEGYHFK